MPNPYLARALREQADNRLSVIAETAPQGYGEFTVPALRDEISRRNEGRAEDEQVAPDGANKPDLIKALEADDTTQNKES